MKEVLKKLPAMDDESLSECLASEGFMTSNGLAVVGDGGGLSEETKPEVPFPFQY